MQTTQANPNRRRSRRHEQQIQRVWSKALGAARTIAATAFVITRKGTTKNMIAYVLFSLCRQPEFIGTVAIARATASIIFLVLIFYDRYRTIADFYLAGTCHPLAVMSELCVCSVSCGRHHTKLTALSQQTLREGRRLGIQNGL